MGRTHTLPGEDASLKQIAYRRACALVAEGYDLAAIAVRERMPSVSTLRRWLTEKDDFHARYERARPAREDRWIADLVALADALAGPTRSGVRLRVEARKWRLAMLRKDALKATARSADKPAKSKAAEDHGNGPEELSREDIISAHLQAVLDGKFDTPLESFDEKR